MNQRLVNVICWIIGSVFCILNILFNDDRMVWGLITVLFVMNAVRQFQLYQKEKENDHG